MEKSEKFITANNPHGWVQKCDKTEIHGPHEWQVSDGDYTDSRCPGNPDHDDPKTRVFEHWALVSVQEDGSWLEHIESQSRERVDNVLDAFGPVAGKDVLLIKRVTIDTVVER